MKKKNITILITGLILFIVSLILDKNTSSLISSIKNPVFDLIFNWFTSFVNVFVILILVTTLFLFEEKKREWIPPLWLSLLISVIVSFVLKLMIARSRPVDLFYPLIPILNFSFPSMHAMVAFAAVPILDKEFFKLKWFWIIFASLVAFSRIYFGFHFLSDGVFGIFTGYFIGILVVYFEEKYRPFRFLK